MKREEIAILAHLLTAIKDAIKELEKDQKTKDIERVALAKREILNLQTQIDRVL